MNPADKSKEELLQELETLQARVAELERYGAGRGWAQESSQEDLSQLQNVIEELQVAEEELRQQNEKLAVSHQAEEQTRQLFQGLFEFAPDGYVVTDTSGNIRRANRAASTSFNTQEGLLLGKPLVLFIGEGHRAKFHSLLPQLMRSERIHGWETPIQARDGSHFHASITASALRDAHGAVTGLCWLIHDITERKKAEKALADSSKRFELLAHVADELLRSPEPQKIVEELCRIVMEYLDCHACFNFLADEGAGKLRLNACAGISPEEAEKIEWLEYGVAVCGCAARDAMRIVAEHIPTTPDVRTELVKSFGISAYACHPLFGPGGKVIGTLSFGTRSRETFSEDDLSLMKAIADMVAAAMIRIKNEQALRRANERLEIAHRAAEAGVWDWDIETGHLEWSSKMFELFGLDPSTTVASFEAWESVLHPEDRKKAHSRIDEALEQHAFLRNDYRVVRPDGQTCWINALGQGTYDEQGRPIRMSGICVDITERKQTELQLKEMAEKYSTLFNTTSDGIWIHNLNGEILEVNDAYCRMSGYSRDELIHMPISKVEAAESPEEIADHIKKVLEVGGHDRFESRHRRKDGSIFDVDITALYFEKDGGRMAIFVRDITERKRGEERLAADLSALTRMHALSTRILETEGPESLMQEIMDAAVAIMRADKGTFQLLEGETLHIVAHYGHQRPFLEFFASAENVASVCGEATKRGQRVVVEDVEDSPLFAGTASLKALRDAGVRAVQSTPLLSRNGKLLGILTTQWSNPYIPDEHDQWRLDLLIRQASDLIEHKQAEEALRKGESTLAEAQRIARAGSWEWNIKTGQVQWSDELYRIFGKDPEVYVPDLLRILELVHPDDREAARKAREQAVTEATPISIDYRIVLEDGSIRVLHSDGAVTDVDDLGNPTRVMGMTQDITERKHAEEYLRQTSDYLENLLTYANAPIIVWNPSFRITRFNHAFERLTGYEAREVVGKHLEILFPEATRGESLNKIVRTVKGEYWESVEIPILRKDGEVALALWNSANIHAEDGKTVIATIAQGQDITERKRAEESLRETRDYLENLLTYANAPIIVWDPSFNITRFNYAFERLTGYEAREVVGKHLEILFPGATREESQAKIVVALRGEYWESVEIPILRKDGEVRVALWNSANIHAEDGKTVIATIAQGQDITERKIAEEALRIAKDEAENEKRRLEAIMEALPVGVAMTDARGGSIQANAMFERIWGGTRPGQRPPARSADDYVAYQAWWADTGRAITPEEWASIQVVQKGKSVVGQVLEIRRFDGSHGFVHNSAAPIRDSAGKVIGSAVAVQDITELRRIQDALRESEIRYRALSKSLQKTVTEQVEHLKQMENLAAIGRMVSVVAHEIRNPLQNIRLGMDTFRRILGKDEEKLEILGEIEHGVNLLNDTVNELLEYSRPVRLEPAPWPIGQIVQQALKALPHKLNTITTELELEREDREIVVDASRMVRALVNIIANAAEAMPQGGSLKIKTELPSKRRLLLSIADTGHGMDAETLERLFQPFHSTKTQGTGLGLSIARKIIEAHRGAITVKSRPNRGTTVKITLPIRPGK